MVAWVGRNGIWEKASWGRMEEELREIWGARGVFPAMTGYDFAFLLEPVPRHDGPDPSFRYLAGAGRPHMLDGPRGAECALVEGKPL